MVYDLIIIGAGPAGVSAAIYTARQKINLLVISKEMGGQIAKKTVDIENYLGFNKISGADLIKTFEEQLIKNEVKVVFDEVSKIKKEGENFKINTVLGETYEALAVIVATGADPRPLEAEGEKEYIGKGVSYCALCDGPVFRDKTVAVVGGGNAGFETALYLSNYVKKIYVLEFGDTAKADPENQQMLGKLGKAEIITNAKVTKIEGEQFVKSLTYQNTKDNKPADAQGSGMARENKLEVEGVFIEIGHAPATAFVKDLVEFSDKDEVVTDLESYATRTPGLFAAGDCNKGKYKQIVTSAGEGAKAALAVYEYLQKLKNTK